MKILATLLLPAVTFFGSPQYKANPHKEVRIIQAIGEGVKAPPPFAGLGSAVEHNAVLYAPEPKENKPVPEVWRQLAVCESGIQGQPRWHYSGGSGFDGGLQFHPRTWSSFKPSHYPAYAYEATPAQQVHVGRHVAAQQGAQAWPSCTAKLDISTEDLLR